MEKVTVHNIDWGYIPQLPSHHPDVEAPKEEAQKHMLEWVFEDLGLPIPNIKRRGRNGFVIDGVGLVIHWLAELSGPTLQLSEPGLRIWRDKKGDETWLDQRITDIIGWEYRVCAVVASGALGSIATHTNTTLAQGQRLIGFVDSNGGSTPLNKAMVNAYKPANWLLAELKSVCFLDARLAKWIKSQKPTVRPFSEACLAEKAAHKAIRDHIGYCGSSRSIVLCGDSSRSWYEKSTSTFVEGNYRMVSQVWLDAWGQDAEVKRKWREFALAHEPNVDPAYSRFSIEVLIHPDLRHTQIGQIHSLNSVAA